MANLIDYPTLQEVADADREQICYWYRFIRTATSMEEGLILKRICLKYRDLGGMTPEISKKIGWKP